ncbi:hypothetical protein [Chryseobacterium sp.]|uniref:hypothetical protein n=1 Tax=Chryseobacterium sp. TaxID=1871047 RepID=UPI0011C9EEF0|nr:hypothetical protein [Chryseobacterium sp.]TXF79544.1 hypothetical protein FUA25_03945 [Chryseobacterium sp.]
MIKRLKYKEIDFKKYENCIDTSVQKNFYAHREILDFLSGNWEILVYGDYEFVMPVPFVKKFGLRFVHIPLFCQQLGVFGKKDCPEINLEFLTFLQNNFRTVIYAFNCKNTIRNYAVTKKNYFLGKGDYALNRKNYFKGRKSTVKSAQHLIFKELQLDSELLAFIEKHFKGLDKSADRNKFLTYVTYLNQEEKLRIFGSFKEVKLTNLALITDSGSSFSLLGLMNDDEFMKENGSSFLIDRILKEYLHERSFDFMGGNIRGIEVFFKSFGAQLQEYPIVQPSKLKIFTNIFPNQQ